MTRKWAGAVYIFLLALVFSTPIQAACQSRHIGLVTVSRHINPSHDYNEKHYGPYLRCDVGGPWSWQAGAYRNSFERTTVYGMVNYVPFVFGSPDLRLKLGGSIGLGTGYSDSVSPLAGALAVVEIDRQAHVGLFFNPAVVAAIVELRF